MPRYDDDDDDYGDISLGNRRESRAPGPRPMSGLGMASLGIAVFTVFVMMGVIVIAVAAEQNGGPMNDMDPLAIAMGVGILGAIGMALVGLVLGLVGSFQADRNPVLAIVGSALNALILLGAISLICAGLVMG